MTTIMSPPRSVGQAADGRPGWTTSRPSLATRVEFTQGRSYTEAEWSAVEARVYREGDGRYGVVVVRLSTRSGWSGHAKAVLGRGGRATPGAALDLADAMLADVLARRHGGDR